MMSFYDENDELDENINEEEPLIDDDIKQKIKDKGLDKLDEQLRKRASNNSSSSSNLDRNISSLGKDVTKKAANESEKAIVKESTNQVAKKAGEEVAKKAGTEAAKKVAKDTAVKAGTKVAVEAGVNAVPVVGQVISVCLVAFDLLKAYYKKKKEEKENGEHKIPKWLIIFGVFVAVIILLIASVSAIKTDEVIEPLQDLIQRREKRYATSSKVTYERHLKDEEGKDTSETEKVKPIILFTEEEIKELLYTSYYTLDKSNKVGINFATYENSEQAINEISAIDVINMPFTEAELAAIKTKGVEDPCYNQTLYLEGTNEIADLLSSMGVDPDNFAASEFESDDQLVIASNFVKYCIEVQKKNFNDIKWNSGNDNLKYKVEKSERFDSEDNYKNTSKKTTYSGDGTVEAKPINDSDKEEYLDCGLKIPSISKYPITNVNYRNGNYLFSDDSDEEAKALMQYVDLTDLHLMNWIVPFSLLTDTNGDFEWVQKIVEDAESDVNVTLYELQQLEKVIEREYYLDTYSYYTFTVETDRIEAYIFLGKTFYRTVTDKADYGTHPSGEGGTLYNGVSVVLGEGDEKRNSKDYSVGEKGADVSELNNRGIQANGGSRITNVKLHTKLKTDASGNYIISKDASGKDMIKEIRVRRELSTYDVVPKITKSEDMYDIFEYEYLINPINEDDSAGETIGNTNAPVSKTTENTGTRTTTKIFKETLNTKSFEKKGYSLSYLSDEQEEKLNRKISRIEWVQDFGKVVNGSVDGVPVDSSEITDRLWKELINYGCTEIAAAAIMGNIQQESSFNPTLENSIGAYGLCQWLNGRRTNLQKFAEGMGMSEADLDAQIAFLLSELKTSFNGYGGSVRSFEAFNAIDDIEEAVDQFCLSFERPGTLDRADVRIENRRSYGKDWYATYAGSYNSSSSSTDENTNNSSNSTIDSSQTLITIASRIHDTYKSWNYSNSFNKPVPFQDGLGVYDCSSYVCYILLEAGFEEMRGGQKTAAGLDVWCQQQGWQQIDNISDLQPGDILFYVNKNSGGSKISHVDILVEKINDTTAKVYSGGSNNSIHSSGPSTQSLVGNSMYFVRGFRASGVSGAGSVGNVEFGIGNIYTMYPSKSNEKKREAYKKYYGVRTTKNDTNVPLGYAYEELVIAFEYIEKYYESIAYIDDGYGDYGGGGTISPDGIENMINGNGTYSKPLAGGTMTTNPNGKYPSGRFHGAIDWGVPVGTTVYACADGVVVSAGMTSSGYANLVVLQHPDGNRTYYAHGNGVFYVSPGQAVTKGQPIMQSGNTGNSTGPHLHFEVRVPPYSYNGNATGYGQDSRVDPFRYL